MKFLVDNNLSFRVADFLDKTFSGSAHVAAFDLNEHTEDIQIWNFAKEKGFLILTKDNDFEAMSRLYGCPPRVIQLTCGNKTTTEIITILNKSAKSIRFFGKDNKNCLMYLR